jgi:hypothetical protein
MRLIPVLLCFIPLCTAPGLPAVDKKSDKPAPLLLKEDFELTKDGEIPTGYSKNGAVGVVSDIAHSGQRALRMDAAINGARRITMTGPAIAALGTSHWGRLYFKVQLPHAQVNKDDPKNRVIHSTLVSAKAQSPLHIDPIEVRVLDTILFASGKTNYIYNVQPKSRPEFAIGSKPDYQYTDQWTLAEWFVDYDTQTYTLFINGEEIPKASFSNGAGKFEKSEIPAVFESMSFGWNNYQQANPGFVSWIDDIALSKERIGTQGIPEVVKPSKK